MDIKVTSQSQLIAYLEACLAYMDLRGLHLAAAHLSQTIEVLGTATSQQGSALDTQ